MGDGNINGRGSVFVYPPCQRNKEHKESTRCKKEYSVAPQILYFPSHCIHDSIDSPTSASEKTYPQRSMIVGTRFQKRLCFVFPPYVNERDHARSIAEYAIGFNFVGYP